MFLRRSVLLLVAAAFACAAPVPSPSDVPRMTAGELKAMLGRPGLAVIDVRADRDWADSGEKIAGAVREAAGAEAAWAPKYGKDQTLVLYCA